MAADAVATIFITLGGESNGKKVLFTFLAEGNATMRELLGGKGANLAEMTSLGLPVPQGFTITTEACTQYYEDGQYKSTMKFMAEINGVHRKDGRNHRQEVRR